MAESKGAAELPPAGAAELPPEGAAAPELPPLEADDGYDDGYDDEEDDFFAPPAEDAPVKSKKRRLEEAIAAQHVSAHSLERDYKETAPPPPAEADAPPEPTPEAELAAADAAGEVARIQAELARDYPGRHQKPKPAPGVDKRSIAPGQKDRKGKPVTFNSKEKRSRAARGDNDYVQEEKRILRQATDGYAMGY